MRVPRIVCTSILVMSLCVHAGAQGRSRSISLRKRLHVNPLITEPDTMDIEWGGAFSTGGDFTLPAVIHYTPEGPHAWWGRTEFSAAFDSLASSVDSDHRVTNFSDRMNLAATCVFHDGEKLDLAIAPQVAILMRGGSGVRVGSTAIARYDSGRSSAGVTATWTAATVPDDDNPAGTFDLGAGYGIQLGRLTPHTNWVWERSTGVAHQISVFEGVEYQATSNFAIDFSIQHVNVWGGVRDTQVVVGMTVGTGRLHGPHH